MWVSCSLDRSAFLWDNRKQQPATSLLRNYENQLTAIRWTTQNEHKELVLIGDEIGKNWNIQPGLYSQAVKIPSILLWVGSGGSQLWKWNFQKMSKILGISFKNRVEGSENHKLGGYSKKFKKFIQNFNKGLIFFKKLKKIHQKFKIFLKN